MTAILWSIAYSPWSERAGWALDHARVEYRLRPYRPVVDELPLRRRLGRWSGPVSVPILDTDDGVVEGSLAIARWADAHGWRAASLFPVEHERAIAQVDGLAEAGLAAGRALSLGRVLADPDSQRSLLPRPLRRALGPLAAPAAGVGIRRTLRKYAAVTPAEPAKALAQVLDRLRAALSASPTAGDELPTLLGPFTYADITAAQVLAFVDPPDALPMSRAARATYRDAALAERYRDLLDWRDQLYRRYRQPGS